MTDANEVEMGAGELDEFLGAGGTGVLSLSTTGKVAPHSVPVSYGYDPSERTFYFRLAVGEDSEKGDLADRAATFVTYRTDAADGGAGGVTTDGRWESVVARGYLERIDEAGVGTEALAGLERVDIPLVDAFDTSIRTVSFEFFRLEPDQLTGRKESLLND